MVAVDRVDTAAGRRDGPARWRPGPAGAPRATRRDVLRAAGTATVLAATAALAGCARAEGPDELEAPLAAARGDAAAAAAAVAAFPELTARVGPVAEARRAHADALAAEVRRARPDRAPAVDAPTPPAAAPASAAAAVAALRRALEAARDGARALALRTEPYRCGLLASVAASCAGHATVLV